ncbi:MAG: hypothetical protein AAGJ79_13025 [Verrucomicrobiota bacterium]
MPPHFLALVLALLASSISAQVHVIGWQTFENAGANNNSGISDNSPDSNSTFDLTPIGSNSNGLYLTGIIGPGASVQGRFGFGQNANNSFLNGPDFGGGGNGINIIDVSLADGSPGVRIGPQGGSGTSSWKFRTNGSQEFGDFSITNESDFAFRLERIHYDARAGNANSALDLDLIYLAGGTSNLVRADNGNEVADLSVISDINFASQPSTQSISESLAAAYGTAVRLEPGETASFRFRWTNSTTDFAESQIDNLAFSGTFQDQNNGFVTIDPVSFIPEPSGALMTFLGLGLLIGRRMRK